MGIMFSMMQFVTMGLWLLLVSMSASRSCGASMVGARDVAQYVKEHTCHHFDADRACMRSELLYGHVFNGIEEVEPDSQIGHKLQENIVQDIKQRTPKKLTAHTGISCGKVAGDRHSNCTWKPTSVNVDSIKLIDLNYVDDETQRQMLANFSHSRSVSIGVSVFATSHAQWTASTDSSSGSVRLEHQTAHTIDAKAVVHLLDFRFQFVSQETSSKETAEIDTEGEIDEESVQSSPSHSVQNIRIVNYNIWNSNPPQWLFKTRQARWNRYIQRMNFLKKTIRDTRPDVLILQETQEVRMDETLDQSKGRYNQMDHLSTLFPSYQFVFQAANLFPHAMEKQERDEEGVGIMSRYPIVDTDYLLLSQDYDDEEDEHRRVILHAVLSIPGRMRDSDSKCGTASVYNSTHCAELIDVFTTHFPLSKSARQRHTQELLQYVRHSRKGSIQILGGDLNAEPHEDEIRLLSDPSKNPSAKYLLDAWLCHHAEPSTEDDASPEERMNSLTFASDNATKRIDYLFVSGQPEAMENMDEVCPHYPFPLPSIPNTSKKSKSMKLKHINAPFLIGQDYMEGSGDPEKSDGMVDKNSPLYPSDHRGLVLDISIET